VTEAWWRERAACTLSGRHLVQAQKVHHRNRVARGFGAIVRGLLSGQPGLVLIAGQEEAAHSVLEVVGKNTIKRDGVFEPPHGARGLEQIERS